MGNTVDLLRVWEKYAFLPVAVTEYGSGKTLMVGFVNKESLALTLKTHKAYYYYPKEDKVRKKGAHSGNTQIVRTIKMNCKKDSFLFVVEQKGTVCRTGSDTCFIHDVYDFNESKHEKFGRLILDEEEN